MNNLYVFYNNNFPNVVIRKILTYMSHPNAYAIIQKIKKYNVGYYNIEYRYNQIKWRPLIIKNKVDYKWMELQIVWLDLHSKKNTENIKRFLRKISVGLPTECINCECSGERCFKCYWY